MKLLLPSSLPKMPLQLIRMVQQVIRQSRITTRSDPKNSIPRRPRRRAERARRRACPARHRILQRPAARMTATTRLTAPPSRGLLSNTGITTHRYCTTKPTGPRTGFGALQPSNFSLPKFALPESQALPVGAGPLMAFPTVNSPNFGPDNTVQGGAAGVLEARLNWGILGGLATYQHTLSGVGSQLVTVQPILYYNFQQGWYFRSDAVMQFNSYSHTNVVPVGVGFGKVVQLEGGYVLNGYVEVQPSVFRSGRGSPDLQIETGIQIQFPTSLTSGWKF